MADVVVVGAGVMGASIALELQRSGRSVLVVDRGDVKSPDFLQSECDNRLFVDLRPRYPVEGVRREAEPLDRVFIELGESLVP